MKKNPFINLGNLGLYKTFRVNEDRSANGYLPPKYNETEYKHHMDYRMERGETKSLEILEEIFSEHPLEGGKTVSEPANTNIPTPVNANTATPKNTKNTIEGLGILDYLERESVGLEDDISYINDFMRNMKDVPLYTDVKDMVMHRLDCFKIDLSYSGTADAKAFLDHIEKVQQELRDFDGTNLYEEFKEHEKTVLSNFKHRLSTTSDADGLDTLIYEFSDFGSVYNYSSENPEFEELYQQMVDKHAYIEKEGLVTE